MATPARIGYINYCTDGTASAFSEAAGFEADSVLNALTYERWKPTTPSWIIINLGAKKEINYVAIGAHTLSGIAYSIQYSSDGSNYITAKNTTATDDNAIFATFALKNVQYIKINVGTTYINSDTAIGVVYAGTYLEMPIEFTSGMDVPSLSRNTEYRTNKSESGQWLGRSITRQGHKNRFSWDYIPLSTYVTNIEPFSVSAQTNPFFIQWSPDNYPTQALYCWTDTDIKPKLTNTKDFVQFSFDAEGI